MIVIKCNDPSVGPLKSGGGEPYPTRRYSFSSSSHVKKAFGYEITNTIEVNFLEKKLPTETIYSLSEFKGSFEVKRPEITNNTFRFVCSTPFKLDLGKVHDDVILLLDQNSSNITDPNLIKSFLLLERFGLYVFPSVNGLLDDPYEPNNNWVLINKIINHITNPEKLRKLSDFLYLKDLLRKTKLFSSETFYRPLFYSLEILKDFSIKIEADNVFYMILDLSTRNEEEDFFPVKEFYLSKNFQKELGKLARRRKKF